MPSDESGRHALPCVGNVNMLNDPEGFHILKPAGKGP
jgi:hypothetical protein